MDAEDLLALDCKAAAGDRTAAAMVRFHEAHPDGPATAEQHVEHDALSRERPGSARRRPGKAPTLG